MRERNKNSNLYSDSKFNFASNDTCDYRIYIDLLDFKRENDNCVGIIEKAVKSMRDFCSPIPTDIIQR